jgi:mycofactocin system transcriptional regulator
MLSELRPAGDAAMTLGSHRDGSLNSHRDGSLSSHRDGSLSSHRGRPPHTSRRELEVIALRLFTDQGFEQTSIEQIAAAAGVNRRTLFRYFDSKSAILWNDFDAEVAAIRLAFARVDDSVPMMDAIRQVVVAVNRYSAADIPELRARLNLIVSVPALQASAGPHYEEWERAVSEFAGRRLDQPADSLYPLAIGRTTLAACRAAYDRWLARADADLTGYLDVAMAALAAGFAAETLAATSDPP